MSETSIALESLGSGSFELLAMAVLRRVHPEYAGLVHTGINIEGKTVKDPVDGIFLLADASPPHFIIVHHTTDKIIERKWLHKNKHPDSKGTRFIIIEGDVIKAIQWAEKLRQSEPDTIVTLILTTNRRVDSSIYVKVANECRSGNIEMGPVWENSRFADYLDHDANGQWLRKKFLGIDQERLSEDLLRQLCHQNCDLYYQKLFRPDSAYWVERVLEQEIHQAIFYKEQELTLLVADSGFGKSTIAYRILKAHLDRGMFGLWINPLIASCGITIENIISNTLQHLQPSLEKDSGGKALSWGSRTNPLLIIVDDINRSPTPHRLIEHIASWVRNIKSKDKDYYVFRIICPLWPTVFEQINPQAYEKIKSFAIYGGPLSPSEGAEAVQKKSKAQQFYITGIEGKEISEMLSHDPILINMWEPSLPAQKDWEDIKQKIIENYIYRQLEQVAINGTFVADDLFESLITLANNMLINRITEPEWAQIREWFDGNLEKLEGLRLIVHAGQLCHLEGETGKKRLLFRHDRVRDAVMARSIYIWLQRGDILNDILIELFYSEVIGHALILGDYDLGLVQRVAETNPLALFFSFNRFRHPSTLFHHAIVNQILSWIRNYMETGKCINSLRWEIEGILSKTDSTLVNDFTANLNFSQGVCFARLRNGDALSGVKLCSKFGPSSNFPYLEMIIDNARNKFNKQFIGELRAILSDPKSTDSIRVGALNLAGYIEDPDIAEAILNCWQGAENKKDALFSAIWAATRCCAKNPEITLAPILDFWSGLSDEEKENGRSEKSEVVTSLRLALNRGIKDSALEFLIIYARENSSLTNLLAVVLAWIDNPEAILFTTNMVAESYRIAEETGGAPIWAHMTLDRWNPRRSNGKRLSEASLNALRKVWKSEGGDKHLRIATFDFWSQNAKNSELSILQNIKKESVLYPIALKTRLIIGDLSAAKEVITETMKAKHKEFWMHYYQYGWCETLKNFLHDYLYDRGKKIEHKYGSYQYEGDWAISTLLTQINQKDALEILLTQWDHLRFTKQYIQVALYLGTKECLDKAKESIINWPENDSVFEHIMWIFDDRRTDRQEKLSQNKLENLIPYLNRLDEHTIYDLGEICNRFGFHQWRRQYIDAIIAPKYREMICPDDEQLFLQLDDCLTRGWIHSSWMENFENRGDPPDRALRIVRSWLESRRSPQALKIASQCLVVLGTRKDIILLDIEGLPMEDPDVERIKEEAKYLLFRRTLK